MAKKQKPEKRTRSRATKPQWRKLGFDSSLEYVTQKNSSNKLKYHAIEPIPYVIEKTYEPDFSYHQSDEPGKPLLVETKGNPAHWDRQAFKAFFHQYKDRYAIKVLLEKEVRLPGCKKLTNVGWCAKEGIPYAVGTKIPDQWLGL